MIKAIIWDIGGVIRLPKDKSKLESKNLHNSVRELWILIKDAEINNEKLYKRFKKVYLKSSRGKISKERTLKKLLKVFKKKNKEEIEKIITDTYKNNSIENQELVKIIIKLNKKKYKQGILSTQWYLSNDDSMSKECSKIFKEKVISHLDKKTKPNKKAFKLILKKMKSSPKQTIFIDDNQKNINAARRLGIHTILFKNNTQLKKDLAKLGVK